MFKNTENKIENLLSPFLKMKRVSIFVLLFLITLGVVLPQQSFAEWYKPWTWLDPVGNSLLNALILGVSSIAVAITSTLVALAAAILGWVTSPGFLNLKFTDNPMVNAGWGVARDLANMFIVLGFVVVGLATILRIREYEAQKKLVPLIIVAVLINFSKLFTGIVIDAANIIMDYFLTQGGAVPLSFTSQVTEQFGKLWAEGFSAAPLENLTRAIGVIFFHIILFVALIIYAFIFLLRYVMLWILVILSPLAFFFRVFDFTKTYWSRWLSAFIMWAFIGAPLAFFLWLADMAFVSGLTSNPGEVSLGQATLPGLLFQFLLPGFILIAGFFVSISMGGIGARVSRTGLAVLTGAGLAAGAMAGGGALARARMAAQRMQQGAATLQRRYQAGSALGLPPHRAAAEAATRAARRTYRRLPTAPSSAPITMPAWVPRYGGQQIIPGGRWAQATRVATIPIRSAWAVTRGTLAATWAVGGAAARGGWARGRRARGQVTCGNCGHNSPAGTAFCPHCGDPM